MRKASVAHVVSGFIGDRWVGVVLHATYFQPPRQRPKKVVSFTNVFFHPEAMKLELAGYADAYIDAHARDGGDGDLLHEISSCDVSLLGIAEAVGGEFGRKWCSALRSEPHDLLALINRLVVENQIRSDTLFHTLGLGFFYTNALSGEFASSFAYGGAYRFKVSADRDHIWDTITFKETT